MNPIVKKLLQILLPAIIGSGITIKVTDMLSVKCTPELSQGVQ